MKNKLIKKHLLGDPIEYSRNTNNMFINQRQAIHDAAEKYYKEHPEDRDKTRVGEFAFRPVRYAEGVDPYIDTFTGKPILNGQNILTRNGKVVTAKSLDWLDWLAETGLTLPGTNLPELHVEYNKDTKSTHKYTGLSWDEMNAAAENAPIATTLEWEQQAQNNFDTNSIILLNLKKMAADRRAHELTPGVGSLALLGTVGTLAAWDPLAFITSLGAAKIGEETLDFPFLQQGYLSFGDWWLGPDASDTAKEAVNLGTWLAGGAGYSTAKMYQAAAKNLAKRLGTEWAAKSLSAMYPAHNPYPQLVLEVPAVEISSAPLRSSKLPGIFFAKAGELNEGSIAGNWVIRALAPGNALEKRVTPLGLISRKNVEWYLKQSNVSNAEKTLMRSALSRFPEDQNIPYNSFVLKVSEQLPKFNTKTEGKWVNYGFDRLGYATEREIPDGTGGLVDITPADGTRRYAFSIHSPLGFNNRHYLGANGHIRFFTTQEDPEVLYFIENLSDWALQGLRNNVFAKGSVEEYAAKHYLDRLLLLMMLIAKQNGYNKIRVPVEATAAKIENFKAKNLLGKTLDIEVKYNQRANQWITEKHPEFIELSEAENSAFNKLQMAEWNFSVYKSNLGNKYNFDGALYHTYQDIITDYDIASKLSNEEISLLKLLEGLIKSASEEREKIRAVYDKTRFSLMDDPYYQQLQAQKKAELELMLKNSVPVYAPEHQRILDKYNKFPEQVKNIFGNKTNVRVVSDAKNNQWYEIDIPEDMDTRKLIFSKVGEVNKGSVAGASRRPILRKNMHEFSDAEWDAAYEAALAKGNKREMWRLLTLRFLLKALEYIANGGGDPKILYRGNYKDLVPSFRDNVWLTSDPKYALNFTADRTGGWFPIFDEKKVKPYFVKGSSEQILPGSVIKDLPKDLLMRDWTWTDIANDLVFGVPERVRTYSETLDLLINDAINNGATSLEIMQLFKSDPLINKAYNLGKADVLVGHDSPVKPTGVYKHWIPSSGMEYNVKNPNYVKLAKLITYDDNGNMIPLSQRFNFWRNDRRYGWLIPLLPFLYGNKKDQAE